MLFMHLLQGHLAFLLYFINMVNYTDFNVKLTLQLGLNQLVMMYYPSYECVCVYVDSIC